MITLLPFLYLIIGFVVGKSSVNIKKISSLILTKFVIPLVIIWNVSLYIEQMVWVIGITILVMLVIFFIQDFFCKNSIKSLCSCYLNIGWLGLPISQALLGEDAARFVLAAYIGSSIFGNSLGSNFLTNEKISIIKVLSSPPVVALSIGCLLIPYGSFIETYAYYIYFVCKILMSFLGMMILGIWLSEVNLSLSDFSRYTITYFNRIFIFYILVVIAMSLSHIFGFEVLYHQLSWLFLICLLPPAANIIVLETYYLGTGSSAVRISIETIVSILSISIYGMIIYSIGL